MTDLSESTLETATLAWFASLGYETVVGESPLKSRERIGCADPTVRQGVVAAVRRQPRVSSASPSPRRGQRGLWC